MYDFFDIFNTIVKRDIDINDLQVRFLPSRTITTPTTQLSQLSQHWQHSHNTTQIIFLDKLPDGFFAGIWQEAFSPNHKIGHIDDLKNMYDGKICYKHAFFDPNGGTTRLPPTTHAHSTNTLPVTQCPILSPGFEPFSNRIWCVSHLCISTTSPTSSWRAWYVLLVVVDVRW